MDCSTINYVRCKQSSIHSYCPVPIIRFLGRKALKDIVKYWQHFHRLLLFFKPGVLYI